jgi:predicted RNA binding protein YcfA (HicA-like mRNA interferase family)
MSKKLLQKALASPNNLRFTDMVTLAESFGFRLSRSSGSHHLFIHPQVKELLNLQEVRGKAKSYQIGQFLKLVEKYNLELGEDQ